VSTPPRLRFTEDVEHRAALANESGLAATVCTPDLRNASWSGRHNSHLHAP